MSAFTKLRESNFSATEQRIADYILKNSADLPDLTISTVAEACGTSKSMVVQLCKTAGFKGYKDLCSQLLIEQALSDQRDEGLYEDIHPGFTAAQICQITIRQEIRSIQDTYELIDPDAVEKAVQMLMDADRIQLFGVGGSAVAALDLYNKLCRIGLNARFSQDIHCQLLETASLTPRGVAIIISFNGMTNDMIDACVLSKESGAKIISITRFSHNAVRDMADLSLYVASNESLRRVTAMSSRLSTLTMVDMLFACLASKMSDTIQPIVRRSTEIAQRRRKGGTRE